MIVHTMWFGSAWKAIFLVSTEPFPLRIKRIVPTIIQFLKTHKAGRSIKGLFSSLTEFSRNAECFSACLNQLGCFSNYLRRQVLAFGLSETVEFVSTFKIKLGDIIGSTYGISKCLGSGEVQLQNISIKKEKNGKAQSRSMCTSPHLEMMSYLPAE